MNVNKTLKAFKFAQVAYVCTYGRMDVCGRTDSHVTTKVFELDGLPNFPTSRAPLLEI